MELSIGKLKITGTNIGENKDTLELSEEMMNVESKAEVQQEKVSISYQDHEPQYGGGCG